MKEIVLFIDNLQDIEPPDIPEGYAIRCFRDGDKKVWREVIHAAFAPIGGCPSNVVDREMAEEGWTPEQTFFGVIGDNPIAVTTAKKHPGSVSSPQTCKRCGRIGWTAVVPDHQCKGVGTALLRMALIWFRDNGFDGVVCIPANREVAKFYEKIGFREIQG